MNTITTKCVHCESKNSIIRDAAYIVILSATLSNGDLMDHFVMCLCKLCYEAARSIADLGTTEIVHAVIDIKPD